MSLHGKLRKVRDSDGPVASVAMGIYLWKWGMEHLKL